MITNETQAASWLRALPDWTPAKGAQLESLVELLRLENGRQNLVADASLSGVFRRHIADSAQLLSYVPRETVRWMDLGTGAGFPGLVIAILRPSSRLLLVEARARRIDWLRSAALQLQLANVEVLGSALNRVTTQHVDVLSARAFAPLPKLIAQAARFSTSDTRWVLPKGRSAAQELSELRDRPNTFHVEQSLTDPDAGIIVGELLKQKALEQ